jgi:hypothetical protein
MQFYISFRTENSSWAAKNFSAVAALFFSSPFLLNLKMCPLYDFKSHCKCVHLNGFGSWALKFFTGFIYSKQYHIRQKQVQIDKNSMNWNMFMFAYTMSCPHRNPDTPISYKATRVHCMLWLWFHLLCGERGQTRVIWQWWQWISYQILFACELLYGRVGWCPAVFISQ